MSSDWLQKSRDWISPSSQFTESYAQSPHGLTGCSTINNVGVAKIEEDKRRSC